ncbi:MAG: TlyA family RNA methyltransferase [Pseudomonadota bacterium]
MLNKNKTQKINIVSVLLEMSLVDNVEHAKSLINCKLVFLGDECLKTSSEITQADIEAKGLRVKYSKPYVSRGAQKLLSVFKSIELDVKDLRCADIGCSTGGFTQLLLEKGAAFVCAVDVGKGLIDNKLKNDPKVLVMEGVNARIFSEYEVVRKNIPLGSLDLAVFDLSFISLKLVVNSVTPYIKKQGCVITLVKPQFEVDRENVEKGGVVRDQNVIDALLSDMKLFFGSNGLTVLKVVPSELKGPSGNQEYFYVMQKK